MSTESAPAPEALATRLLELADNVTDRPLLVGIDGVDGAGKTEFSARLRERLVARGRDAIVIHIDDFHRLEADRYRRGRDSPDGFWFDSYDYDAFRSYVLDPLLVDKEGSYRPVFSDLESDTIVTPPEQSAAPGSIVIVEGIFLQRDELAWAWDYTVFLDVSTAESVARTAVRDGTPTDADHPRAQRYVIAQERYRTGFRPAERADCLIDNSDWSAPRVLRVRGGSPLQPRT